MPSFLIWILVPLALLGFGWLSRVLAENRERLTSVPPGELVDIGGRRLHMMKRGSGGPTVVIESGGASSSAMWWPLQDALADTCCVVSYDRAGLGWSDAAPLPRTMEQRVDDLEALLHCAGITPPCVLVGLSYGGPLIRLYAKRHPDRVAGLVFIDISHEAVFTTPGAQTYLHRTSTALKVIATAATFGIPRLLRLRGLIKEATALPYTAPQLQALTSRYPTAHSFRAGADEFASVLRLGEAMQELGKPGLLGSTPVSVISHGQPFPGPFAVLETNHMEGQRALAALSDNSELVIAENSSHAIPLQEPQLVIAAIRRVVHAVQYKSRLQTTG
ncbi:MAG TPA: alpha/beta hydrolase [Candidatus Acidoferrum sp.]|nr:alpha/beta hydrolase [Candidatus Acidoferrum sp.]